MRPLGSPPTPSATSSDSEPVGIMPSRDSAQMHKVENLLCNIFDGGTVRVYFRFQDTGRAMLARHMAVKDDPLLRAELERILGKDCVKVQDVEHSAK